jgi:hypothetical protein
MGDVMAYRFDVMKYIDDFNEAIDFGRDVVANGN